MSYCSSSFIFIIRLSEDYIRKKKRMLAKFPLPEPWIEVYDAGVGRHYYWNQDTDEVWVLYLGTPSNFDFLGLLVVSETPESGNWRSSTETRQRIN